MNWFERVPKVELHLHLEGAIPHATLWQLVEKYGGDPSVPTVEALEQRFQYRDFPDFIRMWIWKNGFLRRYEARTGKLHSRHRIPVPGGTKMCAIRPDCKVLACATGKTLHLVELLAGKAKRDEVEAGLVRYV